MIGMNQQSMNGINKHILLKNIIIHEPISRIELSHLTGPVSYTHIRAH